ncbi:hypothetical protein DCC85_18545 [Paenibacillus sp. CAA11]|uniref:O-antigen ligase family protein n=1 Tax=Paenibacillus sp. CAA11 TaxID=1532905 RepID=UPI000D3B137C|nr:O-antigen ligase family protein [Paenibacillus sp. CAA11]AWB45971.1 hypothetical protein DCC85_18545 [Paenibacillus sp. CAA11]
MNRAKDTAGSAAAGAAVCLAGLYACMQTGLYFDRELFKAAAALLLGAALLLLRVAARRGGGGVLTPFLPYRAALYMAGPLLLCALYGAHLAAGPLSAAATAAAVLRWSSLAALAVLLLAAAGTRAGRRWLQCGWTAAGAVLAGTALAAVYGLLPLPFAILRTADADIAATGARLGGLLQYPNVFGAVMAAFGLQQLSKLAASAAGRGRAGWRYALHTLGLLPFALCLMLSESRGAGIVAAVGWGCALLQMRTARAKLRLVLYTVATAAATVPLGIRLAQAGLAPPLYPSLLELVSGLCILPLLMWLADRLIDWQVRAGISKRRGRGGGNHLLLLAALLLAILALAACGRGLLGLVRPLGLWQRGGATWESRLVMYRDAWRLMEQAPWWGQGGGVWRSVYRSVQSAPYAGAEMHSGYFNLLLDTGAIGLAIYVLWLGFLGQGLLRRRSSWAPAFVVLALHQLVDVDMRFHLSLCLLLWAAVLGGGGTGRRPDEAKEGARRANRAGGQIASQCAAGLSAAALLGLSAAGWSAAHGIELYQQAVYTPSSSERAAGLRAALEWNPLLVPARLALAKGLPAAEAASLLQEGHRLEPVQPELLWGIATALGRAGDPEAQGWFIRALARDPYSLQKQTAVQRELLALAGQLVQRGKAEEALQVAGTSRSLYHQYAELAERLAAIPGARNDRGFGLTQSSGAFAAELASRAAGLRRSTERSAERPF